MQPHKSSSCHLKTKHLLPPEGRTSNTSPVCNTEGTDFSGSQIGKHRSKKLCSLSVMSLTKSEYPAETNNKRPVALTSHNMWILEQLLLCHISQHFDQELDLQFASWEHSEWSLLSSTCCTRSTPICI